MDVSLILALPIGWSSVEEVYGKKPKDLDCNTMILP